MLLVADLANASAVLVNGQGTPIDFAFVGEEVFLRVSWTTTDLTPANAYVVRADIDGVALDSQLFSGQVGQDVQLFTTFSGWFTSSGQHTATITLDINNTVIEPIEFNNQGTLFLNTVVPAIPGKFQLPIAGTPFVDWSVPFYTDVDPRTSFSDFTGGDFTRSNQEGMVFELPHFSASRELSAERAKIIKQMWGVEGEVAPEMSWAEVNRIASTGYQSFDDAFGGKAEREDVIDLVKRGKYRVRRNP